MWCDRVRAVVALVAVVVPTPSPSAPASPSASVRASASPPASASPRPSVSASVSPAASPSPTGPDPVRVQQWYLNFLHIDQVHQITRGAGVVIALIDTGVDDHPD